MRRYTKDMAGLPKDEANLALLRADIHRLLDGHQFAIVPKPSSPSASSSSLVQSSERSSFAFAAHVLQTDNEAREFGDLYHNVAISQSGHDRLSPEYLFARFAWAIFSHLQTFLNSSTRRYIAVAVRDENDVDSFNIELKQMNGEELTKYLSNRGVTRSGSKTRKRSSYQMTWDGEDLEVDDAYQERWERRSRSFDRSSVSSDASSDDLDPRMRQIRDNTRWYEEVGQFSQAHEQRQEQIDRNTQWAVLSSGAGRRREAK
ncbi:hypothetical protein VP1G_04377 [Cytospora mali]|uniref:HNH nuclease domain-containing protein n=1 Tax=Cytospora mali TaxID=578113 RepID=A0A194UZJ5_CYTMA|nr:hypothetical protein VP1G_04377 [Valsa mali var. pyri (nom. inval.)]